MEAASMSKMLSEELRDSLMIEAQLNDEATVFQQGLARFPAPPISQRLSKEKLSYQSPIARILAAQYPIDSAWIAQTLIRRMASQRQKCSAIKWRQTTASQPDSSRLNSVICSHFELQSPLDGNGIICLPLAVCSDQTPALLSWVLDEAALLEWLSHAHRVLTTMPWSRFTVKPRIQEKKISHQRLFTWQYAQNQCRRWLLLVPEEEGRRGEAPKGLSERTLACLDSQLMLPLAKALPLIAAQMAVVDALALSPQKGIATVDHLTKVLGDWLRPQVLNNLRLRHLAEIEVTALLIELTQRLVSHALRSYFDQEPVQSL